MEKAFKTMGYKTQVKALSDFHDDYGLKAGDDDEADGGDESGSEDDEDMSGEDESGSDRDEL